MTEDELKESLKQWAHSVIDRGADLEKLRVVFLCLASSYYSNESSETFGSHAQIVHDMTTHGYAATPDAKLLERLRSGRSHLYGKDQELDTVARLQDLAARLSAEAPLLLRAATQIESLLQRLDALWQEHRWCGS